MRPDLKLHLAVGACLGFLGGFHSFEAGLALAAFAGASKEAWDYFSKRGTPALDDAVYTAAGGIVGAAIVTIGAFLL
jgi:hypothetical protein